MVIEKNIHAERKISELHKKCITKWVKNTRFAASSSERAAFVQRVKFACVILSPSAKLKILNIIATLSFGLSKV